MTEDDVRELLKKVLETRTQVDLARELKVSQQYIFDVKIGRKRPGPKILDFLGLKWELVPKGK